MNAYTALQTEARLVQHFLSGFDTARAPRVGVMPSGQTMWIQNFPLPDGMRPDHVDAALVYPNFPVEPCKGIYLLSSATHRGLIAELQRRFNVFQNNAFHGAPAVEGYEWICFGYLNGWRYNVSAPNRGDNTAKMLMEFWRALQEVR